MRFMLIITLFAAALFSACTNKPAYEDGKYIIWSGRGAILTAKPAPAEATWTLPTDPPINNRVFVAKKTRESDDRLLQSPEDKIRKANAGANKPNFLSEKEVALLQAKGHKAEADGQDEVAARVWEFLANDRPNNATFALNASKAWARLGNTSAAIVAARKAWKRGFDDLATFKRHKDFAKLREEAAWASLMIEFEVRALRAED